MKRKIITLLTALVVFACAAVPVSAAGFSESFCGTRLWCWIPSCVQPSCPSETPEETASNIGFEYNPFSDPYNSYY